jgi:transcriptional regulator with XRE-family HTH domain
MASDATIPHAVVELMIEHELTPVRAWREHLKIEASDIAGRLGISPAAYALLEDDAMPAPAFVRSVAEALGVSFEQVDLY